MSYFSQKEPYLIPIIHATKPSDSFKCGVSSELVTITTPMDVLTGQCPKLLHFIKVIHLYDIQMCKSNPLCKTQSLESGWAI